MNSFWKKLAKFGLTDKNKELSGGIFACVAAVLIYLTTLNTKVYIQSPIVSTTVPRALCLLMFIIGAVMIVRWCVARKNGKLQESERDIANKNSDPDFTDVIAKITPFCCFVLMTLYVALMRPLGFISASVLYLTVQIPLLSVDFSAKSFLKAFVIGLITAVAAYLIFSTGFGLRLPKNVLGF